MRKLSLVILLFLAVVAQAQKRFSVYAVGFYNLENLFDYTHDEGKRDYEFLPEGSYKWNKMKYESKLRNMSRVLSEMGTDVLPQAGCALIGVSEVENNHVMTDLVAQEPLKQRGYQFVHIEGPDARGVDCALIYNPALFQVRDTKLRPYFYEQPSDSARKTRGFLIVDGTLAGEFVTVIVCHWPSRGAGAYYRELAAKQAKFVKDSLLADDPSRKILLMGDMNDDPTNRSMHEVLGAKAEVDEVGAADMYNPWYNLLVKKGVGTLTYRGAWNLFDQIVLTPNLLNQHGAKEFSTLKYWKSQIFRRDYLFQTEGKYKGSPKRTTSGGVWLDGYSDHLPVVVYLMKEQK